jgi:hypothetical protein
MDLATIQRILVVIISRLISLLVIFIPTVNPATHETGPFLPQCPG